MPCFLRKVSPSFCRETLVALVKRPAPRYCPGWHAYVDGKEARILAANYAFWAVEVRDGKHRVEFRYRPWSFYAGLSVTCVAIAFGTAVVFRRRDVVRVRDEAESDDRRLRITREKNKRAAGSPAALFTRRVEVRR